MVPSLCTAVRAGASSAGSIRSSCWWASRKLRKAARAWAARSSESCPAGVRADSRVCDGSRVSKRPLRGSTKAEPGWIPIRIRSRLASDAAALGSCSRVARGRSGMSRSLLENSRLSRLPAAFSSLFGSTNAATCRVATPRHRTDRSNNRREHRNIRLSSGVVDVSEIRRQSTRPAGCGELFLPKEKAGAHCKARRFPWPQSHGSTKRQISTDRRAEAGRTKKYRLGVSLRSNSNCVPMERASSRPGPDLAEGTLVKDR